LDTVKDEFGSTALHWAALKGLPKVCVELLEQGQSVNLKYGE